MCSHRSGRLHARYPVARGGALRRGWHSARRAVPRSATMRRVADVTIGQEARHLLRRHNLGVLSTHSVEVPGYPFGSVTPYAVDRAGEPLILISSIAQHT